MLVKYDVDFKDGLEGWISVRLIYSGCRRAIEGRPCEGCHNRWLWEFKPGACRKKLSDWIGRLQGFGWTPSGVILTGGEPLDQDPEEIAFDVSLVRSVFGRLPLLVYTGHEWAEELKRHPVVRMANYLKVGPYLKDIPPGRYASGNQRLVVLS